MAIEDDEIAVGAAEISTALFGTPTRYRWVYRLAETTDIPFFKLGGRLAGRPSVLREWLAKQEARAVQRLEAAS